MVHGEARQYEGQGGSLPSGVQVRQSWRPSTVLAADAFISGLVNRSEPLMRNAVQRSLWFEQFTRRVQPWAGWSPLSLEFSATEQSLAGQAQAAPATRSSNENESIATHRSFAASARSSPNVSLHGATVTQQPRVESALTRPAIQLAVLRTTSPPIQREANYPIELPQVPSDRPSTYTNHPIAFPASTDDQPALQPRIALSVSSTPRKEVRGGFPTFQQPLPASPAVALPEVQQPLPQQMPLPAPGLPAAAPSSLPVAQSAIEKLIENAFLPTSIPNLEMRLVIPENRTSQPNQHPQEASDSQAAIGTSGSPPPIPPPQPNLDINAIADKVYHTLQRRQQFERERRGLY